MVAVDPRSGPGSATTRHAARHSQNAVSGRNRRIASGAVLAATAGMMACHPGLPTKGTAADAGPARCLTARPATASEATAAAMGSAISAAI